MSDKEIKEKAIKRYNAFVGYRPIIDTDDVIVFLEKEIDSLRAKNDELKTAIDRDEKEIKRCREEIGKKRIALNSMYGAMTAEAITKQLDGLERESVAKSVQEMADRWRATSKRIEQLGRMMEDRLNVGQIEDGGKMTIKNAACYQDIVSVLLSNGYFVCCHFDENNGETITIEYWRA